MKPRIVIIGIDGAPYQLMKDLAEQGVMRNFQELAQAGIFRPMRSSLPHISSVSWTSIITGKNPGEHGIFGFSQLIPGTYSLSFPDFNCLKAPAFWHKPSWQDKQAVILNVPATFPAKPLNGLQIAGFIALDLERAVFPQEELAFLKEINYQVDVDASLAHQSPSLFLEKLFAVNEARLKALKHFWTCFDWDVFCFVFTGSDRLGHFFWQDYLEPGRSFHRDFLAYFKRLDQVFGEIASRLGSSDSLVMLSDHGMEKIKTNFFINNFLEKTGFLSLEQSPARGYNRISLKTKAFALDPGRIYLNKKGRYPRAELEPGQETAALNELVKLFQGLEKDGQRVIKDVFWQKEIYHGPCLAQAPDLVLVEEPGFRLRGALGQDGLFDQDIFTGKHTLDNAFLLVFSPQKRIGQLVKARPQVEDIVPLLEALIEGPS